MNKLLISLLAVGLLSTPLAAKEIIQELSVADGFSINIFASDVENARQLAVSKKGIVYVGSRKAGNVYALIDHNSDGIADKQILVASGLTMPSGLAIKEGDLYVGEVHRIIRFKNIDTQLKAPKYEVVYDIA